MFNFANCAQMYHLRNVHPTVLTNEDNTIQPTIPAAFAMRKCDDKHAREITKRIGNMKDMLAFNVADGEGLRELMVFVEPGYRIPSRTTLTNHLEQQYAERKAELKVKLENVNVTITTTC